jgi:transcriptional regulator with XRE-family HTH domain
MPEPTAFGKRLRAARELRGMSQSELEVSHFETGVRANASADTLVKLANALKVSVDYLLGRTDDSVPRGGAVEAVFRKVESASDDTIEHLMTIARALAEQDKKKRA